MTTETVALLERHIAKPGTGVHRDPDGSLAYACSECEMDWPCDVVKLGEAARAVLDWEEKERWGGPHDNLADLLGYWPRETGLDAEELHHSAPWNDTSS